MLVHLIPWHKGPQLTLSDGLNILGKGKDCTIRIVHDTITDNHCSLQCVAGTVIARDLKSGGKTLVNGQSILRVALSDGDELQLGQLTYCVRIDRQWKSPDSNDTGLDDAPSKPKRSATTESRNKPTSKAVTTPTSRPIAVSDVPNKSTDLPRAVPEEESAAVEPVEVRPAVFEPAVQDDIGIRSPVVRRVRASQPREPVRWADWIAKLNGSHLLLVACLFFLIVYYGVPWSRMGETPDRVLRDYYVAKLAEIEDLVDRNAPDTEWQAAKLKWSSQNENYVRELTKTASSQRPARQMLLFTARDHLPQLFAAPPSQRAAALSKLQDSLNDVQLILNDHAGYLSELREREMSTRPFAEPTPSANGPVPKFEPRP